MVTTKYKKIIKLKSSIYDLFFDYEIDKKIRNIIILITSEFLCILPFFSCMGHLEFKIKDRLVGYFGINPDEENKINRIEIPLNFKPPFLSLRFLDGREKKRVIENLIKFKFEEYKIKEIDMDNLEDINVAIKEIEEYYKDLKKFVLITYFFEKGWDTITFTLFPNMDNKTDDQVSDEGEDFLNKVYEYLKQDYNNLKTKYKLKTEEDCGCFAKDDICEPIFKQLAHTIVLPKYVKKKRWLKYVKSLMTQPFIDKVKIDTTEYTTNVNNNNNKDFFYKISCEFNNYRELFRNREKLKFYKR